MNEETEGFAKTLTLLSQVTVDNVKSTLENMESLVGFFDLEPNRVCDLVLNFFELHPDNPGTTC